MSALGVVAGALLLIVLAIVRSLLVDEAKGQLADLAGSLVERAVLRLPEGRQEEKRDEWMGELEVQRGKPLSALRWSWNLYRSRRSTAHELRADADSAPLWEPEAKTPPALSAEPLNPRLQAAVDLAKRFGWQDILAAMVDPALSDVEKPLGEATDRFCATITETRTAADQVLSRYGPYFDRQTGRRYGPLPVTARRPADFRSVVPVNLRLKSPTVQRASDHSVLGFLTSALALLLTLLAYPHAPWVSTAIVAAGLLAWIRTRRGDSRHGHFTPATIMFAGFYVGLFMLLGVDEGLVMVPLLAVLLFGLRRET